MLSFRCDNGIVSRTTDWNHPPWPGIIVTTCMSHLLIGGPGKEEELTSYHQPEEFGKDQQEITVHMVYQVKALVTQSCSILHDPMNFSLPGSSIYGFLQARILEWVAISFSRGSSQPRVRTEVSCIASRFFIIWATREALHLNNLPESS